MHVVRRKMGEKCVSPVTPLLCGLDGVGPGSSDYGIRLPKVAGDVGDIDT